MPPATCTPTPTAGVPWSPPNSTSRPRGRAAPRRLAVGDTPPPLRARHPPRPGPPQQAALRLLGYEPEEAHRVGLTQRAGQPLEPDAIVSLPGDLERHVGTRRARQGHGPDGGFHSFITLETPHIQERRRGRPRGGRVRGIPRRIDPRVNDFDPLPPHPPPHQVVARAVGDRVNRPPPVHARDQAIGG